MLMKKRVENGESIMTTVYSYQQQETESNQSLYKEVEYQDGIISKEISYLSEDRRVVMLYRNGEPVAELTYRGEEIVERRSLIGPEQ